MNDDEIKKEFENVDIDARDLSNEELEDIFSRVETLMKEEEKKYTTVTFPFIESIFKKLPISYYAGRDINASLSPTEPGSYYNWKADEIVVSGPSIAKMMSHLEESENIELNIRSCLYHEISHVLLTPPTLFDGYDQLYSQALNVFEDERIETLFWDKYYGVDFKKNIMDLNNWKGEEPQDAFGAFYSTVRYRTGDSDDLNTVKALINDYAKITRKDPKGYMFDEYRTKIVELYMKIAKKWLEENAHDKLEKEQPNYDESSEAAKRRAVEKVLKKEAEEREKSGSQKAGEGQAVMTDMEDDSHWGESTSIKHGPDQSNMKDAKGMTREVSEKDEKSAKAAESLEKKILKERSECHPNESTSPMPKKPQDILSTMANKFIDNSLTNDMKQILDNFLARTKNNDAAIERYSGVLNPRSLTRDDWRIFTYKAKGGPIKGYDKLHLNLFIDTSGSYNSNQKATNTILKSLDTLEKEYDFFSFDLVTCQVGETLRDKKERCIQAYGGNYLDDKVWGIYNKLQDPRALNYTIALFDGDAFTDCRGSLDKAMKNFGVFNSSKCSIISDVDNKKYIEKYAPQAHAVIVGDGGRRQSYSTLLFKNILTAMSRALL